MTEDVLDLVRKRYDLSEVVPEPTERLKLFCDFHNRGFPGVYSGSAPGTAYYYAPSKRRKPEPKKPRWQPKKWGPPPVRKKPKPATLPPVKPAAKPIIKFFPGSSPMKPGQVPLTTKGMRLLAQHPYFRLGKIIFNYYDLYEVYASPQAETYDFAGAGWELLCKTDYSPSLICIAAGHPTGLGYSSGNSPTSSPLCTTNSQPLTNGGVWPTGADLPSGLRTLRIGPMITAGAPSCFVRMNIREHWTRPLAKPASVTKYIPPRHAAILPRADAEPWAQPQSMPWLLIPHRTDVIPGFLEKGNGPRRVPLVRQPLPRKPPVHRERKTRNPWMGPFLKLLGGFHALTEGGDFVGGIHDALPNNIKKEAGPGILGKINNILKNWNKIDPKAAIGNLIGNHYEDKALGGLHKALGNAGIGVGPNGQPYLKRDVLGGRGPSPHFGRRMF